MPIQNATEVLTITLLAILHQDEQERIACRSFHSTQCVNSFVAYTAPQHGELRRHDLTRRRMRRNQNCHQGSQQFGQGTGPRGFFQIIEPTQNNNQGTSSGLISIVNKWARPRLLAFPKNHPPNTTLLRSHLSSATSCWSHGCMFWPDLNSFECTQQAGANLASTNMSPPLVCVARRISSR